jgi:hypothetical protein
VTFELETIRADIFAYANNNLAQNVVRGVLPEPGDIVWTNNTFAPYVVARFGDMAQGGGRSFIGARGDQYYIMVDFFCVAPSPTIAEQVQSKVIDVMLGYKPLGFGQLNKMPGGSGFTVTDEVRPTVFVAPASFRMSFNIVE